MQEPNTEHWDWLDLILLGLVTLGTACVLTIFGVAFFWTLDKLGLM